MDWLKQDFSFALRFLAKRWGMTTVAVVVMSLGISLTASMYAIIKGVILSGPDYPELEQIVHMQTTIPMSEFHQSVRIHDYLVWKEQLTVFSEMAAYTGTSVNLSGEGARAENYSGVRVTASTFDLLQERPFMGRVFTEEEDLQSDLDIAVIGYHVWVNRFSRDQDIIGKTIRVNARPTTIIGVMPEGFRFPELHDLWLPLNVNLGELERRDGPGLQVLGRLIDGFEIADAQTQLSTVAARLEQQFPEANEDIIPVTELWIDVQFVDEETKGLLYTMFVAVIGVLLIACANVANLLFALTMARAKELAIRTAMGAVRGRVLRQLLGETLLLSIGGAALGLVLSKFSLDLFTRVVIPLGIPPWMVFELSPGVIGFVVGVTFFAALASGLLPALQATRADVNSILQDQSRGSSSRSVSRWSTALVTLEVALSCALLVGAGLMVRSTIQVSESDFGLDRFGILTADLQLPAVTYSDSTSRKQFADQLERELAMLPGVSEVALTQSLPVLGTSLNWYGVRDHDYADDSEYTFGGFTRVSEDFFHVIGVTMVAGRTFNSTDVLGSEPVVIVDDRFVERNWPGQEPLGKQVRRGRSDSENEWMTVVGVVRSFDMRRPMDRFRTKEGMFAPIGQQPIGFPRIMLRAAGDPLALVEPVRALVGRLDLDIPVVRINTLEARVDEASLDLVIIGGMFMIFGIVALILASMGLYAVMAFSVSRRTAEVGIRMALGADGGKIIRLILKQGTVPLGIGLVVGLMLAVGLGRALSTFLYDVSAMDPLTLVGIPIVLGLVSLVALLVPAKRAAGIAPSTALREE